MSSYLDSIPQAVATIVTALSSRFGGAQNEKDLAALQTHIVGFTDQLTRTFAKALRDAETEE